jgi:hypothetical protein
VDVPVKDFVFELFLEVSNSQINWLSATLDKTGRDFLCPPVFWRSLIAQKIPEPHISEEVAMSIFIDGSDRQNART